MSRPTPCDWNKPFQFMRRGWERSVVATPHATTPVHPIPPSAGVIAWSSMSAKGHSRRTRACSGFANVRFAPKADKWADISLSPLRARSRHWETMAYFAAVAAFSINAATSRACERKIAWLPGSSMTCDWARFAMNRSRSGLIIRSCLGITA